MAIRRCACSRSSAQETPLNSLVRNGDPNDEARSFLRTIAGTAYYLVGFSAIAYSLFGEQQVSGLNANAAEAALILRDLQRLKPYVREQLPDEEYSDAWATALLERGKIERDEAIAIIFDTTVCRALAFFDFALQTGEESLSETTRESRLSPGTLNQSGWATDFRQDASTRSPAGALRLSLRLGTPNGACPVPGPRKTRSQAARARKGRLSR